MGEHLSRTPPYLWNYQKSYYIEDMKDNTTHWYVRSLYGTMTKNECTQKQLSKITGVDQSNLSKIFNGKISPTLRMLDRITDGIVSHAIEHGKQPYIELWN
jgi:predicted XRE-type DNA-binding protein